MSGAVLASFNSTRLTLAASYAVSHAPGPGAATAGLTLEADGDIITTEGAVNTDEGDWIVPRSAAGGAWEARLVTVSGTLSAGTADTWQQLDVDRTWSVSANMATKEFTGTLEIGRNGTSTALVSASVTLTADGT